MTAPITSTPTTTSRLAFKTKTKKKVATTTPRIISGNDGSVHTSMNERHPSRACQQYAPKREKVCSANPAPGPTGCDLLT